MKGDLKDLCKVLYFAVYAWIRVQSIRLFYEQESISDRKGGSQDFEKLLKKLDKLGSQLFNWVNEEQ